ERPRGRTALRNDPAAAPRLPSGLARPRPHAAVPARRRLHEAGTARSRGDDGAGRVERDGGRSHARSHPRPDPAPPRQPAAPGGGSLMLKRQVERYGRWVVAILILMVFGVASGAFLLAEERFTSPFANRYEIHADFSNATGLTSGLGQPVNVA